MLDFIYTNLISTAPMHVGLVNDALYQALKIPEDYDRRIEGPRFAIVGVLYTAFCFADFFTDNDEKKALFYFTTRAICLIVDHARQSYINEDDEKVYESFTRHAWATTLTTATVYSAMKVGAISALAFPFVSAVWEAIEIIINQKAPREKRV